MTTVGNPRCFYVSVFDRLFKWDIAELNNLLLLISLECVRISRPQTSNSSSNLLLSPFRCSMAQQRCYWCPPDFWQHSTEHTHTNVTRINGFIRFIISFNVLCSAIWKATNKWICRIWANGANTHTHTPIHHDGPICMCIGIDENDRFAKAKILFIFRTWAFLASPKRRNYISFPFIFVLFYSFFLFIPIVRCCFGW